jgi:hypothetical protein
MSNRVILSGFKKLSLLTLFLLAGLSGCQKENENTLYSPENQLSKYATPSGAELVLSQAQEEAIPGALEERDNDWNHNKQPKYPFYPGDCRLILRVYKFDPNVIHGGGDPPCSGSITIRGYSQPNGQGTLLFTDSKSINNGWIQFIIPQTAYILFQINEVMLESGPCRFKVITGEYGWNRSMLEWINVPYNQWLPIVMGRFAPKDPSGNYDYNLYEEYLCSPWCTWSADVSYLPSDDPWDNPWTTTRLACFYGSALPNIYPQDPRVIKDHFIYEKINQQVYLYPIEQLGNHIYTTKAQDLATDPNDMISYMVLGAGGLGVGPFGWGVAGDFALRPGCNLTLTNNR